MEAVIVVLRGFFLIYRGWRRGLQAPEEQRPARSGDTAVQGGVQLNGRIIPTSNKLPYHKLILSPHSRNNNTMVHERPADNMWQGTEDAEKGIDEDEKS